MLVKSVIVRMHYIQCNGQQVFNGEMNPKSCQIRKTHWLDKLNVPVNSLTNLCSRMHCAKGKQVTLQPLQAVVPIDPGFEPCLRRGVENLREL
jgi:hypothetical protein